MIRYRTFAPDPKITQLEISERQFICLRSCNWLPHFFPCQCFSLTNPVGIWSYNAWTAKSIYLPCPSTPSNYLSFSTSTPLPCTGSPTSCLGEEICLEFLSTY